MTTASWSLGAAVAGAYLVGSFPTGYVMARRFQGVDIRTVGSGNIGATNVARVIGKFAGLAVLTIDVLKGTLAVTILPTLIGGCVGQDISVSARLWCGLAVVVGHDWTCWLRFKGGKGIATSLGVMLGLAPAAVGWCAVVWGATFMISRFVSLSSIMASIALPMSLLVLGYSNRWIAFGIALGFIAIIRHNSNIKRMLQHTEQKFRAS